MKVMSKSFWAILNNEDKKVMSYELRVMSKKTSVFGFPSSVFRHSIFCLLPLAFYLLPFISNAQVKSSIDSTKIKIGAQITYKIQVESDTTDLVVFPEGQTFAPLEMIESYKTDTTKNKAKYNQIKQYALTQF